MSEILIRRAGADEIEPLTRWRVEVLREVFSIPQDQPVEGLEAENRRYYQRALASGEHIACFACLDGGIVGCGGVCLYGEMPSPDVPSGRCAYLMNIYVRPEIRGQGVGEAIIKWLVERARETGAEKIYLETSDAGRALYTKLGFVPMPDMMKLPRR